MFRPISLALAGLVFGETCYMMKDKTAIVYASVDTNYGITAASFRLNPTVSKPTCDASFRGMLWISQGASGVKDDVEICVKNQLDVYLWKTLI